MSRQQQYWLSDIGIVGFYFKFGLISSLAVLYIMLKVVFSKIRKEYIFLKLFFIHHFLVIFNQQMAFDGLSHIVVVCIVLYLYDHAREGPSDMQRVNA